MKSVYEVKEKMTGETTKYNYKKDAAAHVGVTTRTIEIQFQNKGYWENKTYIIKKEKVL